MKILFYLEPHPIRDEMTTFDSLIFFFHNLLLDNVDQNIEFKMYANSETLEKAVEKNKEYEKSFIYPTKEEEHFFQSMLVDWNSGGIAKWQELMEENTSNNPYTEIIKNIHQRYSFDYIVNWGSNFAVKQAAKQLGAGYVNMELGCCRQPYVNFYSFVADPWGVNGQSSISKSNIKDFSKIKVSTSAENDLAACSRKLLESSNNNTLNIDKTTKIAFIPLQLYDDANLLMYSPYNEVVDVVKDILPKLQQAGYTCIITEHPSSSLRIGSTIANQKAKDYAVEFDNVIWLGEKDTKPTNQYLYEVCDVVITVNSSSGFEGLFYDKPVVVLGDAVYKVGDVFPSLDEYLNGEYDYQKYKKSIAKIRTFFLKYYLFEENIFDSCKNFARTIKFVGNMSKDNLSVKEIINKYIAFDYRNNKSKTKFKIFKKEKSANGRRRIYFMGMRILSYKKIRSKNKSNIPFSSVRLIEIEIFSFCNRKCWFCPNSFIDRHSKNIFMNEKLYLKILNDLKKVNYNQKISYSRYNEPTANKEIFLKRLSQAREILPNAILHTNTNGDYLTKEYIEELYNAGLRSLNIQNYLKQDEKFDPEKIRISIAKKCDKLGLAYEFKIMKDDWVQAELKYKDDICIQMYSRDFSVNGNNRGGSLENIQTYQRQSPCYIPNTDIYIDYNGKVLPCCNFRSDIDSHSKFVLGDTNKDSILKIFNNKKIKALRNTLNKKNITLHPCCECNFAVSSY